MYKSQEGYGSEGTKPYPIPYVLKSIFDYGWKKLFNQKYAAAIPSRGLRIFPMGEIFHRFPVLRRLGQKCQLRRHIIKVTLEVRMQSMVHSPLDGFQRLNRPFCHPAGIIRDLSDNVDGTRGDDLAFLAHGCGAEKNTECAFRRPVPEIPHLDLLSGVFFQLGFHRDGEIDLIAPAVEPGVPREGSGYLFRGGGIIEDRIQFNSSGSYLDVHAFSFAVSLKREQKTERTSTKQIA
jgi:hypothetical protein